MLLVMRLRLQPQPDSQAADDSALGAQIETEGCASPSPFNRHHSIQISDQTSTVLWQSTRHRSMATLREEATPSDQGYHEERWMIEFVDT